MSKKIVPIYDHSKDDPRPLPERLMSELGADFTIIDLHGGKRMYAVRDWVYHVAGSRAKKISQPWSHLKRALKKDGADEVVEKINHLEVETNSGIQKMDFADENTLYLITQRMSNRSCGQAIFG